MDPDVQYPGVFARRNRLRVLTLVQWLLVMRSLVPGFTTSKSTVESLEGAIARMNAKGVQQTVGDGKRFFAYMESSDLRGFAVELNRVDENGKKVGR